MRKNVWLISFVLIVTAGLLAQSSPVHHFVYTNDNASPQTTGAPNSVSAFRANSDGTLTLLPGSPFRTGGNGSNGGRIAANDIVILYGANSSVAGPSLLYAANQGDGTVSAFFINPSTGNLVPVHGSPFLIDGPPGGNYSLATNPNGTLLFVTNDSTTLIRVYSVSPAGTLAQIHGSPFETGINWLGLKVTANGRFLIAGEASGNDIGVFQIAPTGSLSAVPGSPFPGSAPSVGVTVNCSGSLVFHAGEGAPIDVYHMNLEGTLTPVSGSPFSTTAGFNNALTLSPNGQFLFVADPFGANFTGYISSFAVGQDGTLTPAPGSPSVAVPGDPGVAATTTSQDGKYLYSYTFVSSQVNVQAINADGSLTNIGSFFTATPAVPGAGSGMGIASFPPPLLWTVKYCPFFETTGY